MIAIVLSLALLEVNNAAPAPEELSSRAPVGGFPETTEYEQNLLHAGTGSTRGVWDLTRSGVTLREGVGYGPSLWFPKVEGPIGDGVLRARFKSNASLRVALLFRCEFNEKQIESYRGYGLVLHAQRAKFVRYEQGYARDMGAGIEIPLVGSGQSVEVVLTQVGPYVTAQLYDADTLESLGVVATVAKRFMRGRVGVRGGQGVALTQLSVVRAGTHRANPRAFAGTRIVRVATRQISGLKQKFDAWIVAREKEMLFLRLPPRQFERLIRSGVVPLSVSDHIPWRFVDHAYEQARTQVDVPDFVYKDARMLERALRGLHQQYPYETELISIGQTAGGRDIWALRLTEDLMLADEKPAILIDGAQHGTELWATEYVLDLARSILRDGATAPSQARARSWLKGLDIWVIPLVNPDGRDAFMKFSHLAGRKNFRDLDGDGRSEPREGVDLNRNFPFAWGRFGERGSRTLPWHGRYRGASPASEPESQALMALARRLHPAAAISVHTKGTVVLPPYATRGVKQTRLDEAWHIAEEIVAEVPRQMNGRRYRLRRRLYTVDGVWKDWLRHEFGTLALVVEGPYHNPLDRSVLKQTVEQSRPIWQSLFDRTVSGPLISGWVVNEQNHPVSALVEVVENAPGAGEEWLARPHDGFFVRYLLADKQQTLRVSAAGYETQTHPITSQGAISRKFVLTRTAEVPAH